MPKRNITKLILPLSLFGSGILPPPEEGPLQSKEGILEMSFGMEAEKVYNKSFTMRPSSGNLTGNADGFTADQLAFWTRVMFYETFSISALLGQERLTLSQATTSLTGIDTFSRSSFYYSVQGQVKPLYTQNGALILFGGYRSGQHPVRYFQVNGARTNGGGAKILYNEWDIGAFYSYRFPYLCPYIGASCTFPKIAIANATTIQAQTGSSSYDLKGKKRAILFVGTSITPFALGAIDVQLKMIAERSAKLAFRLTF